MSQQVFRQQLIESLEDAKSANARLGILELYNAVIAILKDGRFAKDDYEDVVTIVTEVFNNLVRPSDGLSDPFDDALESAIRPAIKLLFDKFVAA